MGQQEKRKLETWHILSSRYVFLKFSLHYFMLLMEFNYCQTVLPVTTTTPDPITVSPRSAITASKDLWQPNISHTGQLETWHNNHHLEHWHHDQHNNYDHPLDHHNHQAPAPWPRPQHINSSSSLGSRQCILSPMFVGRMTRGLETQMFWAHCIIISSILP